MRLGEEPAQILDCTKDEYFAIKDAISHSDLDLLLKSPALYKWYIVDGHSRPKIAAFEFGDVFDDLVLWPGPCCSRMAMVPVECLNKRGAVNSRGKIYKAWLAENGHKIVVKPNEALGLMAKSLLAHDRARSLLDADGLYQLKIRWQCRETGTWRRSMLDKYATEQRLIIDLKTTRDASAKSFARDAYNFGYHRQAAYYQDAIAAMNDDGELCPVVFIACQKDPPYLVRVYELADEFLDLGRRENHEGLLRYLRCSLDDKWQEPEDSEIVTLAAPGWAMYESQWSLA